MIPPGMTLLLDTDTPVLSFLLIQGGKLIFDDADIELQANIIMITDGGLLQVILIELQANIIMITDGGLLQVILIG